MGTINTTTGQVTFVGKTQSEIDGLAWVQVLDPSIPTLGEWGQILLVSLLAPGRSEPDRSSSRWRR